MPAITRWFRVTHDINADPELWELRDNFGDRAVLIWLECLSIADRNKGLVGPDSEHTRNQLASKCRSSRVKVGLVLDWYRVKGWLISDGGLRVAKWVKYNKTRDVDQSLSETTPRLTRHDTKRSEVQRPEMSVQEFVESWNETFSQTLPKVEWPLSTSRHAKALKRIKEHLKLDFWSQVFTKISTSNFLLGKNNGDWKCTFDFLIANDTNVIKIYEGAYNGKTENPTAYRR